MTPRDYDAHMPCGPYDDEPADYTDTCLPFYQRVAIIAGLALAAWGTVAAVAVLAWWLL